MTRTARRGSSNQASVAAAAVAESWKPSGLLGSVCTWSQEPRLIIKVKYDRKTQGESRAPQREHWKSSMARPDASCGDQSQVGAARPADSQMFRQPALQPEA